MKPPSLDEKVDLSLPNKVVGPSVTESPQAWSIPLRTVFLLWVITLFDPHIWLSNYVGLIVRQIPAFIYLALGVMIVASPKPRASYPPLLLFMTYAVVSIPFAENIGRTYALVLKVLLLYCILAFGSLTFVTNVNRMMVLIQLFLWQFPWWSFHANFGGFVPWHPDSGNEDSFGPLMVMGLAYSFYYALAANHRRLRWTAFFVSGLCLVGVVSSFARGAVLATGFVVAYAWYRSPRKLRTLAILAVGAALFLIAANTLFPPGHFWSEMATISEATTSDSDLDRWRLWKIAWRAFLDRPIFGVGAGNFGVYAYEHLWSDPELMLYYQRGALWGRPTHNIYFQWLSELGLIGIIAFVWLLLDFWYRNAELRSVPFITAWSATGQRFDLHMLSLGLEAAMVAYLTTGLFYDQFFIHWFYSLLTLNALLHFNTKRLALQQRPQTSQ